MPRSYLEPRGKFKKERRQKREMRLEKKRMKRKEKAA